jgi:CMP-N,N'-diacetyllegionaminic acid synthase
MIGEERVIAVVPARGGSKGIPRKNVAPLGGRPLLAWSIETALGVRYIDRTIVSTDDQAIDEVARRAGAEVYRRPDDLATDAALVADALRDLIHTLRDEGESAGIVVLLEPTCPFRSTKDVSACIEMLVTGDKDSVATFREAELNPHRAWTIANGTPASFIPGADPWLPRQQLPSAYQLNGAVYCFRAEGLQPGEAGLLFGDTGAIIMPEDRSVDIDSPADLLIAEQLLADGGTRATK